MDATTIRELIAASEESRAALDAHVNGCEDCDFFPEGDSLCDEGERLQVGHSAAWGARPRIEDVVALLLQAEVERDEARAWVRKLTAETRTLTCVYCGHAYPPGSLSHGAEVLTEHVKVCEKHPMRALEAQFNTLRDAVRAWCAASNEHKGAFDAFDDAADAERAARVLLPEILHDVNGSPLPDAHKDRGFHNPDWVKWARALDALGKVEDRAKASVDRYNAVHDALFRLCGVVKAGDAAREVCRGCNNEIDPDVCGCGTSREEHGDPMSEGHSFVPAGCDCLRVKSGRAP